VPVDLNEVDRVAGERAAVDLAGVISRSSGFFGLVEEGLGIIDGYAERATPSSVSQTEDGSGRRLIAVIRTLRRPARSVPSVQRTTVPGSDGGSLV